MGVACPVGCVCCRAETEAFGVGRALDLPYDALLACGSGASVAKYASSRVPRPGRFPGPI